MEQSERARTSGSRAWLLALIVLVALRIPSVVQPAGGDQLLYSYVAGRVLDGGVPYRDAFEQKSPGIFGVYALMWGFWPHESAVALADLGAAAMVAWLLWSLGGRMFGGAAGRAAAVIYLLLGDPGIQRLGGLNVRSQCETFIALAVTAALALAWSADRRVFRLMLAGGLVGITFWLKYNAIVYAAPVALAAGLLDRREPLSIRLRSLAWMAGAAAVVLALGLLYFLVTGAFGDLWAGTVGYNLAYSGETYRGVSHVVEYVTTLPIYRARVDGLWFLGGLGALGVAFAIGQPARARIVALTWIAACVVSIAINGSRGLPQYFIQAQPALALTAAAGLAFFWRMRRTGAIRRALSVAAIVLVIAGAWRVGIEETPAARPRLFGVPQAMENLQVDTSYLTGRIPRAQYLGHFEREGPSKFSPLAVERLANYVDLHTPVAAPTYVFGFASAGVYVKTQRPSASRFFWSRPIVLEFEGSRPGYGSAGLLADLERVQPEVIGLQKHDWGLAEDVKDSFDFFMSTPHLRQWLDAAYLLAYEDEQFSVWRRR